MSHPGGRPTKLTPEIRKQTIEYLQYCIDNNKFPSIARLAYNLNVGRKTLYNWGESDPEFLHTIESLGALQEATLLEGSLENKLNATIAKLILSNHGYREKSEQDITSGGKELAAPIVRIIDERQAE